MKRMRATNLEKYLIKVVEPDGREHFLINHFNTKSSAETFVEISNKMWKDKKFIIVPELVTAI